MKKMPTYKKPFGYCKKFKQCRLKYCTSDSNNVKQIS